MPFHAKVAGHNKLKLRVLVLETVARRTIEQLNSVYFSTSSTRVPEKVVRVPYTLVSRLPDILHLSSTRREITGWLLSGLSSRIRCGRGSSLCAIHSCGLQSVTLTTSHMRAGRVPTSPLPPHTLISTAMAHGLVRKGVMYAAKCYNEDV